MTVAALCCTYLSSHCHTICNPNIAYIQQLYALDPSLPVRKWAGSWDYDSRWLAPLMNIWIRPWQVMGTTASQYSRFWLGKDDVHVGCWEVLVQQLHVFTQFGEFGPVHERRRSFCAKITKLLENIFQWTRHTGHRYKTNQLGASCVYVYVRVYGIGHAPRLLISCDQTRAIA